MEHVTADSDKLIQWMSEKISLCYKGGERNDFIKALKKEPKDFLSHYYFDINALIIFYCYETMETVMVADLREFCVQIVERLQENLKAEIANA